VQASWRDDVGRLRARPSNPGGAAGGVERAHAELGGQLREKESTIRRQDEQLREKETMIRTQHEQLGEKEQVLQGQHALLRSQEEQAQRLRAHAEAAAARNAELGLSLEVRAGELARLRDEFDAKAREAAQLAAAADAQRQEIERLGREQAAAIEQLARADREAGEAAKKQADELGRLREQLQRLDEKVRQLEPRIRPPRRPFKQVLVEFVIGPQHYYPPPPKPLPGITVVTVVQTPRRRSATRSSRCSGRRTRTCSTSSVDRGSTDGTADVLNEYRERIDKVVTEPADVPEQDALLKAYGLATYDVIGMLEPGDVFEPGALTRVAEHFRDNPGTRRRCSTRRCRTRAGGSRCRRGRRRTCSACSRRRRAAMRRPAAAAATRSARRAARSSRPTPTRRSAASNRERGPAALWDFWIRLARRYGIQPGEGHVRTRALRPASDGAGGEQSSAFADARKLFESSFGLPGRVRGSLFHWCNRVDDAVRRSTLDRLSFPLAPNGEPLPEGKPPGRVPADQPVCPIDGRMPDRLLFSTRDASGGDDAISYVYHDASADMALVYPPIDLERLGAIYDRGRAAPASVQPPEPGRLSPYAGYRSPRGAVARVLSRVRSPYWWFRRPEFGDVAADELLATLDGAVPRRGGDVRFLNVGCYEGAVLDRLKAETDWTLAGTETNPEAARAARARGHTVWKTSAQDAALSLPVDTLFDVIYLGGLFEHLPDPLLVLRRLRQVLAPGGRIVIDTPNLDSKLLDAFGPTWSHWQVPHHRTLIGRRGLRKLARRGAFRIERLRTRTHPLPVVKSIQLNDLGLAAVVPNTAEFPPDVASRGVLLTGWARLLWDWRGKGDYLYAVLRAE
jgi:SAM-dependent methyltransferase